MLTESASLQVLGQKVQQFPEMVIVLGSGWNAIIDDIQVEVTIPYEELFGVKSTVPGHAGKFIVGSVAGKRVGFMCGRFHMYEGFSARESTLPIRVFQQVGMKQLVVTSASGAINEKYQVGDMIVLSDLITVLLSPDSPLVGPAFTDMSACFDAQLRQRAIIGCVEQSIPFHEGVYAYYHGPQFETPADKMMLKIIGADVVGMSTVPETIMARSLGVDVLGLSFVTNLAFVKHDHKDVLAAAEQGSKRMVALLKSLIV
jgi:purine-nucleoside phosphorylase